jgi:hypothetical protein
MARTKKARRLLANRARQAQLKVRLSEALRFSLEREARARGHSMNAEIVRRLTDSTYARDEPTKVVAEALLNCLPDEVVAEMVETVMEAKVKEAFADIRREEELIRRDSQ